MKKILTLILTLSIMLAMCTPAMAATTGPVPPVREITVSLDGKLMNFDVKPMTQEGRTLVPFRAILEALGCTIGWDTLTQTITATNPTTKIVMSIGSKVATVNGKSVALDVPPAVVNGRSLIPLRFISENTGCIVIWNSAHFRAIIISPKTSFASNVYKNEASAFEMPLPKNWKVVSDIDSSRVEFEDTVTKNTQIVVTTVLNKTGRTFDESISEILTVTDTAYKNYGLSRSTATNTTVSGNPAILLRYSTNYGPEIGNIIVYTLIVVTPTHAYDYSIVLYEPDWLANEALAVKALQLFTVK